MGMFSKKNKESPEQQTNNNLRSEDLARENILSAWAIEPLRFSQKCEQAENPKQERKGYVFCRKCFEVIPMQDIKCAFCGAANNRN